ncbi:uncharacterized protein TRUGW13939_02234 [Talaromyces rugulosus]|uniref:DUF1680 domain protein n=1 Tax=Talaromyces rugulosus TaxID=121627 RepID=A0A7H8QMU7_TALRU|nr:uncharacterized protein TRUGW13939_02234 [Talaromyces rugulosus]QKX55142.1 hypothetical protein TRUGW13939_02234 [Talaromyces rugulosus]
MYYPQTTFKNTTFHGPSLLKTTRETISKQTLYTQLDLLKSTGRYDCFKLEWHPKYDDNTNWPERKHLFWDCDIAKWIEAACYFLMEQYDARLDNAVQEIVGTISSAQQEDGYLNLHYQVVDPGARWTNLRDMHELYNAGHMIEAALSHHQYYHNDLFLGPIVKYVSLMRKTFGARENQIHGYPGHPEIELALLRLYSMTGNEDAYDLARYFLEERGNPSGVNGRHYFDVEAEERGDVPWKRPDAHPMAKSHQYSQAHEPILEQQTIEGHAVRAMYLLTGAADLLCLDKATVQPLGDLRHQWYDAIRRLWDNMVDKKLYLTGGIGAIKQWEGFGIDYFLPQGTDEGGCYAETCAAIGVVMLAERLLEVDLDSRYADMMELCLYNAILTSMSLDGNAFTYTNQLASSHQDKSTREEWFECACCPPNLARLFGSLGGYLWDYGGTKDGAYVNVHLYTTATLAFTIEGEEVIVKQSSAWPWEGKISFTIQAPPTLQLTLRLRVPEWAHGQFKLEPNHACSEQLEKGYIILPPSYTSYTPEFTLDIQGFQPRLIQPHPYTNQQVGAIARGPIVYCAEDIDNPWEHNHFKDVWIPSSTSFRQEWRRDVANKPHEHVAIHTSGYERSYPEWENKPAGTGPGLSVQTPKKISRLQRDLCFIPYYLRANRGGRGQMRVALPLEL